MLLWSYRSRTSSSGPAITFRRTARAASLGVAALLTRLLAAPPAHAEGERGLIGVAVDPAFGTNGFVYVHHTVAGSPARNRVSRVTVPKLQRRRQPDPADYVGDYFYADFCSGWVRRYDVATDRSVDFVAGFSSVVNVRAGRDGALWVLQRDAVERMVGPA
ncbi:MAG: PQQ-dependent sugar dehydrogenase [Actinomycetota bacterium]|nr:PQQ-dependent sugar dehydrogenase [Actinomycetota bacterium]